MSLSRDLQTTRNASQAKFESGAFSGESFAQRLIVWQRQQGRHDLPWQGTRDAYRIWLSEIMLQQTQVTTVIAYYQRFLERFPTVDALAAAPLDAVLELWAGLGYYARARNLHRCAQAVVSEHGGRFPEVVDRLAALPGIGRSTAAAIAVFAFGARAAILDGNVKRVLARCFGVAGFPGASSVERELWALAEALLPSDGIEAYTQGLMDLGATVCVRGTPDCTVCPMRRECVACREGRQAELPAPRPRKPLPTRETKMLLLTDGDAVLLEKRPPLGIWGGLLSLPEVDWGQGGVVDDVADRHGCRVLTSEALPPVPHVFTHFRLEMRILRCRVARQPLVVNSPAWVWLPLSAVAQAALPTPIRRVLSSLAG